MDQNKLDLRKQIVLDLKKDLNITNEKAQVVLALDFSGSMSSLYSNGSVQELLERLLPLALQFDDNGSIDFFLFHDGVIPEEDITLKSIDGLANKVRSRHSMGGTNYAPVINDIVNKFAGSLVSKAKGFLGGLFGKSSTTVEKTKLEHPVYVIFITDGVNDDKSDAELAIRNASNNGIFFQFVGIGGASFPFLEKLDDLSGRVIDNANFFKTPDLSKVSDQDLYRLLLTEFPSFISAARSKGMIN